MVLYLTLEFLQDQGSPQMMLDVQLNVQVTAAVAPPPSFGALVYTVSAMEDDYTQTVRTLFCQLMF